MIPYGKHHVDDEDIEAVADILRGGMLTQGPMVERFEEAVCDYTGAKYAVAVSSCTAALHIGALTAGVKPGKNLITSPITFVASANSALYAGGKPLFCDVDPKTINMSPSSLANVIASEADTKVVVPVHFGGLPCDMMEIRSIANGSGAMVMEDAAHALGGRYKDGSKVGSGTHSDMACFSFHPVKAIAAGEGGLVTTNDEELYRQLLRLRSHGINKLDDPLLSEAAYEDGERKPWYYEMQGLGFHYRITDIQCALALSQLKKLDAFIARRHQLATQYDKAFETFENLRPAQTADRTGSGLHLYVVRIDFAAIGKSRREVMLAMREKGIGSQVHYIPVTAQPFYKQQGFSADATPNAQAYYSQALSIPLFFDLTDEMQADVIDTLRDIVG